MHLSLCTPESHQLCRSPRSALPGVVLGHHRSLEPLPQQLHQHYLRAAQPRDPACTLGCREKHHQLLTSPEPGCSATQQRAIQGAAAGRRLAGAPRLLGEEGDEQRCCSTAVSQELLILLELKLVNGCGGLAGRTARRAWCPSSWPSQKPHLELERNLPGRAEGGHTHAAVPAQLQELAQGPGPV